MMPKVQQTAFAAMYVHQKQPHIMSWTIAGSPFTVRDRVGKQWDGADPKAGWKAARVDGIKVVKIVMTAVQ